MPAASGPTAIFRRRNMKKPLLFCLVFAASAFAQQQVAIVATASSFDPPPAAPTHTKVIPGEALTSCRGNTSYIGDFSSTDLSCSTTYTDPTTVETNSPYAEVATAALTRLQSRRTSYTIVASNDALYVFSCYEKWRWSSCPDFTIGEKLSLIRQKGRLTLKDGSDEKPFRLRFLDSIPKPTDKLPNYADESSLIGKALDTWLGASNCEGIQSFSQCRERVLAGSASLQNVESYWRDVKKELFSIDEHYTQKCTAATSQAVATGDKYLLIQDEILAIYQSIDPKASDAESKWEQGNQSFLELQGEEAKLPSLSASVAAIHNECQK